MPRLFALAAALVVGAAGIAQAQVSFTVLPTSAGVFARGISGNGQVIGGSTGSFGSERPFVWRQVGGAWMRFDLPGEGSQGWGRAVALSFDGDTIVGSTNSYIINSAAGGTPAIWRGVLSGTATVQSPLDDVGLPRRGMFAGVSGDGSRAAGFAVPIAPAGQPEDYYLATTVGTSVISPAGGYRSAFLFGNAMSADGNVAVGSAGVTRRGVKWSESGGWTNLPSPATGAFLNALAECVSGNGLVTGGFLATTAGSYNLDGRACVWTGAGRIDLTTPTANFNARVTALSGDGSIAVGVQHSGIIPIEESSPGAWSSASAVIWVDAQPFLLSSYLTSRGVSLGDVTPRWATGVSADGNTIIGIGSQASTGRMVSFVAVVPEPGIGAEMMLLFVAARRRRRN